MVLCFQFESTSSVTRGISHPKTHQSDCITLLVTLFRLCGVLGQVYESLTYCEPRGNEIISNAFTSLNAQISCSNQFSTIVFMKNNMQMEGSEGVHACAFRALSIQTFGG